MFSFVVIFHLLAALHLILSEETIIRVTPKYNVLFVLFRGTTVDYDKDKYFSRRLPLLKSRVFTTLSFCMNISIRWDGHRVPRIVGRGAHVFLSGRIRRLGGELQGWLAGDEKRGRELSVNMSC